MYTRGSWFIRTVLEEPMEPWVDSTETHYVNWVAFSCGWWSSKLTAGSRCYTNSAYQSSLKPVLCVRRYQVNSIRICSLDSGQFCQHVFTCLPRHKLTILHRPRIYKDAQTSFQLSILKLSSQHLNYSWLITISLWWISSLSLFALGCTSPIRWEDRSTELLEPHSQMLSKVLLSKFLHLQRS